MLEEKANILSLRILEQADAICFTSNGVIKKDGSLVMGAGVAKAFRDRFVGIDQLAGECVKHQGNICQVVFFQICNNKSLDVVAFPTKHHWNQPSSIELIRSSAVQLKALADQNEWKRVYLTRPGCGYGGLLWHNVKPVIESILDDRFIVLSF